MCQESSEMSHDHEVQHDADEEKVADQEDYCAGDDDSHSDLQHELEAAIAVTALPRADIEVVPTADPNVHKLQLACLNWDLESIHVLTHKAWELQLKLRRRKRTCAVASLLLLIMIVAVASSKAKQKNRPGGNAVSSVNGDYGDSDQDLTDDVLFNVTDPHTPIDGSTATIFPTMAPLADGATRAPTLVVHGGGGGGGSGSSYGQTSTPSTSDSSSGGSSPSSSNHCGCAACTDEAWSTVVGSPGFTCGQRISFLQQASPVSYPSEIDACAATAFEYRCECGACDPSRCNVQVENPVLPPSSWTPPSSTTPAPTPGPRSSNEPLYCYPDESSRVRYTMWNDMRVEVKESTGLCGPGNNAFSVDTVSVNGNELMLQYKNNQASEVRVLPPDSNGFDYGTFSFSIKSVQVVDYVGNVLSKVLPKELVLGLFTWDDTEDYASHQNYNHEVDIEISRWNCDDNADLQFLVQPPGFPQMSRVYSGAGDKDTGVGQYDQGGHVYEFTWSPGQIDWYSTNNGGQRFTLTTAEAMYKQATDYVQCQPGSGNTEIRLNLWNMLGAYTPDGLASSDIVQVVLDDFTYSPYTGSPFLSTGDLCAKHCQCETSCVNGQCS